MRAPFDLGRAIAAAWLIAALGVTVAIGPSLGWRGWMWLGAHDVLCVVGAGHELWRKRVTRSDSNKTSRDPDPPSHIVER
jgi:hypothetical protein